MVKVAIVGATGYTGLELIRILVNHPVAEVVMVTSESYKGQKISHVFPGLKGLCELELVDFDADKVADCAEVAFVCLPHGASMEKSQKLYARGMRVVDLSGDFRFKNAETYEKWYKIEHLFKNLLKEAAFGLPELFRDEIVRTRLVANPGCYATSVILALYPLVSEGIISSYPVVADCKSGVTGAGRKPSQRLHYPECNESFMAYSVSGHRHNPEMEEVLLRATGIETQILFIPHLIPMNRGILSTLYVNIDSGLRWEDIYEVYAKYYENEPFVRLYSEGELPTTKDVRGTNYCDIGWVVREDRKKLVVVSAIDNLVKGASGQAVQNMNVMLEMDETAGLIGAPFWV
ncbi:MAG: N-acetyl-gamma-glutamyl-phosphate reductase [Deferribacteres bacterium]|nr:N-acetyl-gamma-glutamyl-phosphate reductase [Deferribacteres bacterium]